MKFVGIDLAWGEHKPSGAAIINEGGIIERARADLRTTEEICDFAGLASGNEAVIAIDAPLIVKNLTGQRPVEIHLTSIFGRYDAGPHSSNRSNPNFQESGKTQRMARLLHDLGYRQQIAPVKQQAQQTLLEVFPAPALVILFPCHLHSTHTHCRPPRYKHKRDRSWPELCSEWEIYRARLRSLECREPVLKFSPEVKKQIGIDITEFKGGRYKQFDDLLDGIFCAYLAYYFWYGGSDRTWVIGDLETGCVTLPRCRLSNCPLHANAMLASAAPE